MDEMTVLTICLSEIMIQTFKDDFKYHKKIIRKCFHVFFYIPF